MLPQAPTSLHSPFRFLCLWAFCLGLVVLLAQARAATTGTVEFDVPAGDAAHTLKTFAAQAGRDLMFPEDPVAGIRTQRVRGLLPPRAALSQLLAGTTLTFTEDAATGAFVVARVRLPGASPHGADPVPTPSPMFSRSKNPIRLLAAWLAGAFGVSDAAHAATGTVSDSPPSAAVVQTGSIIGTVSSADTRNALQGAVVTLPSTGKFVLSDNAGRFVFNDVPTGPVELVISYTGFDEARQSVIVARGEPARLAVELRTSVILRLEAFTVSTEREGNALAITQQRNAANVKNVIAMDSLGNLPNGNAGELIAQLPGLSGTFDGEGNVTNVSIRGTPAALTRVNVDGLPLTIVGDRAPNLHSFSGGLYEQVEVIKGQTPDKSADSLGGMVNLKTRSTLSMTEKRRFSYNLSARWAPPFFERTPMREEHPIHPLMNVSYQEVFGVFGGQRNLGISVNFSYNENVNEINQVFYDYQNSAQAPQFIWDFRSIAYYNNRHVTSTNVKAEYRLSDASRIYFNAIYNLGNEPAIDNNQVRAFTNQVVATLDANGQPTGTGGILPGFTSSITQVRPVAASFFEQANFSLPFWSRTPTLTLGAEHKVGPWEIDYSARYSQTHYDQTAGGGGQFVARVPNVGWIIDRSNPEKPKFIQTAGGDIFDIRSYTSDVSFTRRDNVLDIGLTNLEGNAKYSFATRQPLALKGGFAYRQDTRKRSVIDARQWTRTAGAPPLSTTWLTFETPFDERMGRRLPAIEARGINAELGNAALWTENLYYKPQQLFTSNSKVTEEVQGAYAMMQGKVDRLGFLAGVRFEQTDVSGSGYVRGPLATPAEIPDPVARAIHDYNNPVTNKGSYGRSFPSAHVYYEVTPNLIARASWSTSFGRPGMAALAPSATVNDTAQTVSASNPGIGPQYSKNIDVSLEYYFKPAGLVSLGYFSKDIADYIVTTQIGTIGDGPGNGFSGLYSGYTLSSTVNAGKAEVEGWEFNFMQQLTFLPGVLRGLQLSANYTELRAKGDFGGAVELRTNDVAGFIPKTANVSLTFNYKKFGSRLTLGHVGEYLVTYSAAPTARIYRDAFTSLNGGVSYRLSPKITLYCDATNLTEESLSFYRYVPSLFREARRLQSAVIIGVSGRF